MLLNIVLLTITFILLYLGYVYKGIIIFIVNFLIDDIIAFVYKLKSNKTKYYPERECHELKFFLHDIEYTLLIPDGQIIPQNKILAMTKTEKQTDSLMKVMGPFKNFFGSEIKPLNLGLSRLTIWNDKKKYVFEERDIISFTHYSHHFDFEGYSTDDSSEEECYEGNTQEIIETINEEL